MKLKIRVQLSPKKKKTGKHVRDHLKAKPIRLMGTVTVETTIPETRKLVMSDLRKKYPNHKVTVKSVTVLS